GARESRGGLESLRPLLESWDTGLGGQATGYEPLETARKAAGGFGLRSGDPLAAFRGEGSLHRGNQLVIERVAVVLGRDVTHERAAQEPESAHELEHLEPDKLGFEPQSVVEDRAVADH